jgi:hypothetical protein
MLPQTVERVAGKQTAANRRVVERFHAEVIAGGEKLAATRVPDDEGEIAKQMLGALLAPMVVGLQNQVGVAGVRSCCDSMFTQLA